MSQTELQDLPASRSSFLSTGRSCILAGCRGLSGANSASKQESGGSCWQILQFGGAGAAPGHPERRRSRSRRILRHCTSCRPVLLCGELRILRLAPLAQDDGPGDSGGTTGDDPGRRGRPGATLNQSPLPVTGREPTVTRRETRHRARPHHVTPFAPRDARFAPRDARFAPRDARQPDPAPKSAPPRPANWADPALRAANWADPGFWTTKSASRSTKLPSLQNLLSS